MTGTVVTDAALSDGTEHLYRLGPQQQPPHLSQPDQLFRGCASAWNNRFGGVRNSQAVGDHHHHHQEVHSHGSCSSSVGIIPTAIVKPKYQKILHDDRQLLTNAGGYLDYNKSSTVQQRNSNANPSQQQLNNLCPSRHRVHNNKLQAAFEEATRKKKSVVALGKRSPVSVASGAPSSSSSAIVGVVTPRKKNYNENRSAGVEMGSNNKMSSEWGDISVAGGAATTAATGNSRKTAMDFNENNVISDNRSTNGSSTRRLKEQHAG